MDQLYKHTTTVYYAFTSLWGVLLNRHTKNLMFIYTPTANQSLTKLYFSATIYMHAFFYLLNITLFFLNGKKQKRNNAAVEPTMLASLSK